MKKTQESEKRERKKKDIWYVHKWALIYVSSSWYSVISQEPIHDRGRGREGG